MPGGGGGVQASQVLTETKTGATGRLNFPGGPDRNPACAASPRAEDLNDSSIFFSVTGLLFPGTQLRAGANSETRAGGQPGQGRVQLRGHKCLLSAYYVPGLFRARGRQTFSARGRTVNTNSFEGHVVPAVLAPPALGAGKQLWRRC